MATSFVKLVIVVTRVHCISPDSKWKKNSIVGVSTVCLGQMNRDLTECVFMRLIAILLVSLCVCGFSLFVVYFTTLQLVLVPCCGGRTSPRTSS